MVSLHKRDLHTILLVLECLFIKFGEAKQFLHGGFVRLVLVKSWFLCVVFEGIGGRRR